MIIVFMFPSVALSDDSAEIAKCIQACKASTSLKNLQKMVAFQPIKICIKCCIETKGKCPAKDGSGGPYTGCELCGASGGTYCDGEVH